MVGSHKRKSGNGAADHPFCLLQKRREIGFYADDGGFAVNEAHELIAEESPCATVGLKYGKFTIRCERYGFDCGLLST